MAKYVGLSVLHPGGLKSTSRLAEELKITKNTRVIDIACGKGTTAVYLAKKYGCSVVGVDISEELLNQAILLTKQNKLENLISFKHGDALNLPFKDGEFDVAVSQAMLVLIEDQVKAIGEALRVIRENGMAGWVELSWKDEPTEEFMDEASNEICAYCMSNVSTFQGWEAIFKKGGMKQLNVIKYPIDIRGILSMIADEGFGNAIKVLLKYMTNPTIKKRMDKLNDFFKTYPQYFGYGIYTGKKMAYSL